MKINILLLVISGIFLFACSEEDELQTSPLDITGFWINQNYSDSTIVYEKTDELKPDQYGFSFQSDGKFIERKNAGWCGTPPISFSIHEGSWTLTDSVINVSVAFWGGTANYKWEINSVDNQQLSISVIEENYTIEE